MVNTNDPDWLEERDEQIAHIAEQLTRGRIGFLFGAGMSKPSGGLPGNELSYELVRQGFYKKKTLPLDKEFELQLREVAGKFPLEAIAEGIVDRLPFQESELEEILEKTVFRDEHGKEPI